MNKDEKGQRKFPVIEDLPEEEQAPFREWLIGQTVPVNDDGSHGYYQWDYERWKRGMAPDIFP
jgi:NOL1/NOP2/fmu family ribosome biogenesis protein